MLRILTACALVVAVGILLALLKPQPALSDSGLTNLVNSAYFPRTEDASLHQLAHERAAYQVAYSGGVCDDSGSLTHDGLVSAEVLACNYVGEARAVEQWQGSATHDALLNDPSYELIGCGSAQGLDGATFFACTLSVASVAQPTPMPVVPDPPAEVPAPTPEPAPLPNTAMRGR